MKTFSFSLLMALVGAAATMHAAPILYTFDFTGGSPNATGSFDYDAALTVDPFSSFVVMLDGDTFDFTSTANGETGIGCGGSTGPQSVFNALIGDTTSGCGEQVWVAADESATDERLLLLDGTNTNLLLDDTSATAIPVTNGTFTVPAAVPEPGTLPLFLAGAGALLSWKRRRTQPAIPRQTVKQ